MTRASDDLWKALIGLRRAADNELSGESHRAASQHIADLLTLTGVQGEDAGIAPSDASLGYAASLAEVRSLAERDLSGNAFYLASKILDELASLPAGQAAPPAAWQAHEPAFEHAAPPLPEEPAEPASAAIPEAQPAEADMQAVLPGLSFDELAAASKARVEEVAASLGVEVVHVHQAPPLHHAEAAPAEVELEKRSSEPCSMPEVLPLDIEPVSSSASAIPEPPLPRESTEVASVRDVVEAAHDLGSPAEVAVHIPDFAAPQDEIAPEAPAASEPEGPHEAAPAEAAHAPEPIEPYVEPAVEHPAAPVPQAAPEPEIAVHAPEAPPAEAAHAPEPIEPEVAERPAAAAQPAPEPEIAAHAPAREVPAAEPVQPVVEQAAPAPQPAPEPKPEVSAAPPAQEKAAAAASKKADAGRKEEPLPKQRQKTFFSLWLDMVFGRKK
jgi:hypothetical protein